MVWFCRTVLDKWQEPIRKWGWLTMARMEMDYNMDTFEMRGSCFQTCLDQISLKKHMTYQVLFQRRIVVMRQSWTNQWRHSLGSPLTHLSVRVLAYLEKWPRVMNRASFSVNIKTSKVTMAKIKFTKLWNLISYSYEACQKTSTC